MRYVIVGCGRVGATLAKLLNAEKHDVTVVDENPSAFKRLGARWSGQVEVGTGIDNDVLKRAGTDKADAFVAVTDGDNRNVMAALIAQRMFRVKKIVARIYDPQRGQIYRELGIETFCPTTMGAQLIRDTLMMNPGMTIPTFDYGRMSPLSATVPPGDAGKRVSEIERPGEIRISAVRRGAIVTLASNDMVLNEGDEIGAVVAPEALAEFFRTYANAAPTLPQMKVLA